MQADFWFWWEGVDCSRLRSTRFCLSVIPHHCATFLPTTFVHPFNSKASVYQLSLPDCETKLISLEQKYLYLELSRITCPHGGARPFHQKVTQLTLGPFVMQIWSRNTPKTVPAAPDFIRSSISPSGVQGFSGGAENLVFGRG